MGTLLEMIYESVIDLFLKLAEDKPQREPWVRITATVLGIGVMLAYFIHGAYASWQSGNENKLTMYVSMLALTVILFLALAIRRGFRKKGDSDDE